MFTTTIWFLKKIGRKRNSFWGNGDRGAIRGMSFYLSGEESQQPNRICPACFELQLLTFCGFNEESRVTRRRDFLEFLGFLTFLRFTSIFESISDFSGCSGFVRTLFGHCSGYVRCSLNFVNRKSPLKNKI